MPERLAELERLLGDLDDIGERPDGLRVGNAFDEEGWEALQQAIRYARSKGLGLLEATDVVVPFSDECYSDVRNLRALEHDRRVIGARAKKTRKTAEELGGKLSSLFLTIPAKAGEGGKLFGAVTSRDIAQALESAGVPVDRKMVLLAEPIKQIGEYKVKIKAGTNIVPEVPVRVVAE